jgi:hypothetical protein
VPKDAGQGSAGAPVPAESREPRESRPRTYHCRHDPSSFSEEHVDPTSKRGQREPDAADHLSDILGAQPLELSEVHTEETRSKAQQRTRSSRCSTMVNATALIAEGRNDRGRCDRWRRRTPRWSGRPVRGNGREENDNTSND